MAMRRAIYGLEPLLEKLRRLEEGQSRAIAAQAMHAAAEPVLERAKELAPVMDEALKGHAPPGTLRDSLVIKDKTRGKRRISSSVETKAGNYKGEEYYGAFVELGHKQGRRPKSGESDARAEVEPHPYLEPAFDETVDRSLSIVKQTVASELAKIA